MELKPGYKQTGVGTIPEDWECSTVRDIASKARNAIVGGPFGSDLVSKDYVEYGVPVIRGQNMIGKWISGSFAFVTAAKAKSLEANLARPGDVVFTQRGTLGQVSLVPENSFDSYLVSQSQMKLSVNRQIADPLFYFYVFTSEDQQALIRGGTIQTGIPHINLGILRDIPVQLPLLPEQHAIATTLSDMDELLGALDRLIAKKRDLKQAAMQQLLTGTTRLPGFDGEWEVKTIEDSADCLDNVRVPLNETQRSRMKGDYPYCGANGVLDYVNDYVIDDDIILMAEDGGYFDEYEYRPIAYRMIGKCWINNHAHILKAKLGFDQGFVYYTLVHKNILPFLASGTRAKLNKSEMNKIEMHFPKEKPEQTAIAAILSDMDTEIAVLEKRRDKTRTLKQAMMQELLTGKTRLI